MLYVHASAESMQSTQGGRRISGVRHLRARGAGKSVDQEHRQVDEIVGAASALKDVGTLRAILAAAEMSLHPTVGEQR
jgi:hypothetical protein